MTMEKGRGIDIKEKTEIGEENEGDLRKKGGEEWVGSQRKNGCGREREEDKGVKEVGEFKEEVGV